MKPGPDADCVLLEHMRDCLERIQEYTGGERATFLGSRLVAATQPNTAQAISGTPLTIVTARRNADHSCHVKDTIQINGRVSAATKPSRR